MGIPQVPIERIEPNPTNIRKTFGNIEGLAATMRVVGVLQPLLVRPEPRGRLRIIDGERRYRAARLAGLATLPVVASRAGTRLEQLTTMVAASHHAQLPPLELAKAFERLREEAGLSLVEIAHATGYSPSVVSERLALLRLPVEAQQMVRDETLAVKDAVQLSRQVRSEGRGEARTAVRRSTHLDRGHPLAQLVADQCQHRDTRQFIGGVGCGQCWEDVITRSAAGTQAGAA